jgi:hypothetical protein
MTQNTARLIAVKMRAANLRAASARGPLLLPLSRAIYQWLKLTLATKQQSIT